MSRARLRGLVAFLSIAVAVVAPFPALLGLYGDEAPPGSLLAHLIELARAPALLAVHAIAGAVALLVTPWQLAPRWRARHRGAHRQLGYLYVAGVGISGLAGFAMAFGAWGLPSKLGLGTLAVLWLFTTTMAVQRARAGDLEGHATWMLRSFALTFAAVTFRLQNPLYAAAGLSEAMGYGLVAWTSWIPNLAFVLWWERRRVRPRRETPTAMSPSTFGTPG